MSKHADLYYLPTSDTAETLRGYIARTGIFAALGVLLGMWLGAQYVASRLGYSSLILGQPYLGPAPVEPYVLSWAGLAMLALAATLYVSWHDMRPAMPVLAAVGVLLLVWSYGPLYTPLHLVIWALRYHARGPFGELWPVALRISAVLGGVSCASWLVAIVTNLPRLRRKADVHGSARWASPEEVAPLLAKPESGSGIAGPEGLFLGLYAMGKRVKPLYDDDPHHVFVYAPTRSGKGVGLVVPNLLNWRHSVLVHDIKGENWQLTSGYRRSIGHHAIRFDPTCADGSAARYNPLLEVRRGAHEVRDAQQIADILVDPNGDKTRDHWDRTAHALLTATLLYVLHANEEKTLAACARLLSTPGRSVEDLLKDMVKVKHETIASLAQAMLDKSPNERSGVISTALSFLDLYRDPLVAANTSSSDFTLLDLMHADEPVSLYLTTPASDISRTRPLMRLFLNQAMRRLTEELQYENGRPRAHYKHPLLLLLDEFPSLGRLPFFQESLAFLAGYGIRAFLVTQDLSQHQGVYGREESITANCHVRVAYTPNKGETAELLSQMCGEMTVHQTRVTQQAGGLFSRSSSSPTESRRRLLTADEAMRLPPNEALVFAAGLPPIRSRRARYYEDPLLQRRAAMPAPEQSSRIEERISPWSS